MARNASPGKVPVSFEFAPDLLAALRASAEVNRRSLKAEVVLAIERHLAAPLPSAPAGPVLPEATVEQAKKKSQKKP